jgi:2-keto-4-pentenoate hydratase/2-oxohepta-3-ene-1,7-dioic acid hydratase in catechol pathway
MTKIARFLTADRACRYGLLQGDDLRIIAGDLFGEWRPTGRTVPLSEVKLLAPVSPPNIIAIGRNYRGHVEETGASLPDHPAIFLKATSALCNPGDDIVLPTMAPNEVDFECELAIVIGREARNVSEDEALDYALGYTCGNDVSARDCQRRLDVQWARGKSFDTFAPLGPWIVTDIDPDRAPICSRLNGQIMQSSNTNDLIFSCRYLISYISRNFTLLPGTVIMTGTPAGVGFTRQPPVFLKPGDVTEIEIEGIGVLRNNVVAEA